MFATGKIDRAEVQRSCRDGTSVMVEETLSPVRDDEGRIVGVASIARDIGSRLAVKAALAETRRELESQNRRLERSNADLEQFAYIASAPAGRRRDDDHDRGRRPPGRSG